MKNMLATILLTLSVSALLSCSQRNTEGFIGTTWVGQIDEVDGYTLRFSHYNVVQIDMPRVGISDAHSIECEWTRNKSEQDLISVSCPSVLPDFLQEGRTIHKIFIQNDGADVLYIPNPPGPTYDRTNWSFKKPEPDADAVYLKKVSHNSNAKKNNSKRNGTSKSDSNHLVATCIEYHNVFGLNGQSWSNEVVKEMCTCGAFVAKNAEKNPQEFAGGPLAGFTVKLLQEGYDLQLYDVRVNKQNPKDVVQTYLTRANRPNDEDKIRFVGPTYVGGLANYVNKLEGHKFDEPTIADTCPRLRSALKSNRD